MEVDYRTEHHRMLTMLEYIHKITGEMLEPVRRAGPGAKTQISKNLRDETFGTSPANVLAPAKDKPNVHEVMRELRLKDD